MTKLNGQDWHSATRTAYEAAQTGRTHVVIRMNNGKYRVSALDNLDLVEGENIDRAWFQTSQRPKRAYRA